MCDGRGEAAPVAPRASCNSLHEPDAGSHLSRSSDESENHLVAVGFAGMRSSPGKGPTSGTRHRLSSESIGNRFCRGHKRCNLESRQNKASRHWLDMMFHCVAVGRGCISLCRQISVLPLVLVRLDNSTLREFRLIPRGPCHSAPSPVLTSPRYCGNAETHAQHDRKQRPPPQTPPLRSAGRCCRPRPGHLPRHASVTPIITTTTAEAHHVPIPPA
mmetsp:Transcript_2249/g.6718  ORF Transcript_2249/g.6718 Transcript_2249/m.6718 type:complete len:216 (+) Transcript_2249:255-902(+)